MILDHHRHFLPLAATGAGQPVTVSGLGAGLIEVTVLGKRFEVPEALVDPAAHLDHLDAAGLDGGILQVPPFAVLAELPAADGIAWSRQLNDAVAEAAEESGGRLLASATVPLQAGGRAAATELRRAAGLGMRHVQLLSSLAGASIAGPETEEFWDEAEQRGITVSIHPHFVSGAERMAAFHLRNLIGNPTETALAAALLWTSGVLERHPGLTVVLAHGGGAFPAVLGRLEHGYAIRPEFDAVGLSPSMAAHRFRYDSLVFDPVLLGWLARIVGAERIVVGTDFPFDMGDPDPLANFREIGLTPSPSH